MEPFKITCVSCRAVLTVRKESMIGQIIACPRCSMMVQVIPPADLASTAKPNASTSASGDSATKPNEAKKAKVAASAAVAASLFETEDAVADVAPPAPPAPVHAEPAFAATFDDALDSLHEPVAPAARPAPALTTAAAPHAADPTPPPPPAGLPGEVSRWAAFKFPAMIAGGAGAGAALVATALVLLSGDDSAPVAANVPPSAPAPAAVDQDAASASIDPVAPPAVPNSPQPAASPSAPSDANVAAADAGGNIEPAADNPLAEAPVAPAAAPDPFPAEPKFDEKETLPDNGDAEKVADAPVEEAADNANEKQPAGDKETAAADAPKLRIDPLEIDPEGLNLSTLYNGPPKDPIAASQLPEEASAELSVPEAQQPPPDAEAPVGAPPANGAVRRDEQAAGAPGAATAALLARKTPELKITQLPLCRLLDLSVQLSGVPISVAPEQLRLAAVSAGQPATADVKNATIEEFLTAATKVLRLKPVVVNDQIVLIRGTNNPRSERTFPIDDLANDDAGINRLVALIEQMVAPDQWQSAGGEATIAVDGKQLKINAAEAVQYDVLLLLERSRAALGKPLRSKYPAALIGAEAAPVALADRLSAPATFTFSQYTPLREIFRHWQEEMPVAVLVDWPALADLRLWPNTRIACSSTDKPWHAAFDAVLEPLGLAWRPIDKLTIEITSLEKANSAPLVEIYRLNSETLATVDNLVGELDQVAAASGAPAGGGMATALIDEHGLLVARQPATVQRAFADYLAGKGLLATE